VPAVSERRSASCRSTASSMRLSPYHRKQPLGSPLPRNLTGRYAEGGSGSSGSEVPVRRTGARGQLATLMVLTQISGKRSLDDRSRPSKTGVGTPPQVGQFPEAFAAEFELSTDGRDEMDNG
jgi:hypothetical protein